jgi:hypothetical protein
LRENIQLGITGGDISQARLAAVNLDPRIDAITTHIVHRLAAAAIDDMKARYDFGRVLQSLRSGRPQAGGTGTLRLLSRRLGVDPSALRRYARVSETISPREFTWLMRQRTPRGAPLTWSHVEVLARERDPDRRQVLAAATAAEDLSVRGLATRLLKQR